MKIYGYTRCGNDGCYFYNNNGAWDTSCRESQTGVKADKDEMLKEAYSKYQESFGSYEFEDGKDFEGNPILSEEDFCKSYPNTILIQGSDDHVAVEFFEADIELPYSAKYDIYHEMEREYHMQDAKDHVKEIVERYKDSDDNGDLKMLGTLDSLEESDYDRLAAQFEHKHDCNIDDNSLWDSIIEGYAS